MDRAKKVRAAQRTVITKALNVMEDKLKEADVDRRDIIVALTMLEEKMDQLNETSKDLLNMMIEIGSTDEEIQNECDIADGYKARYIMLKLKATDITTNRDGTMAGACDRKKSFKLPTIELVKFNGDVREWLKFWGQFKKIHEDTDIVTEDKFQYLMQAMVPGSRASELVLSFPPSGENYEKAITSLKNRFGRDELLVEVYVRELLMLVLQKALKPSGKIALASLYDKLESHLRALETLGVTTDKCAAMLFPLVESALPEELLRAWQRKVTSCGNNENKDRLTQLMRFVQSEVESEERIELAVKGFGLNTEDDRQKRIRNKTEPTRNVPTAMGLLTKTNRNVSCIFCKADHDSANCETARKMSMEERRNIVMRNKCCFNCLKGGHSYRQCRTTVQCAWCTKKHVVIMCPEMTKNKPQAEAATRAVEPANNTEIPAAVHSLATVADSAVVYMLTLRVVLKTDKGTRIVRAMLDTGAQRSYILKDVAVDMGLIPVKEESIEHFLFGGVKSAIEKHNIYVVHLKNMNTDYLCKFQVTDQKTICDHVPSVSCHQWADELKNANIVLSDTGNSDEPISILIGADVAGKLLTGRKYAFRNGLTALETLLGWTITGKVPNKETRNDAVLTTMSMYVREADVSELWRLDVVGIDDPVQRVPQQEKEQKVRDDFLRSVRRDAEGRYEVSMTWIEDHAPLPTNESLARRRLDNTTRKLKNDGYYEEYDQVLSEWLSEGIIEKVPDSEAEEYGHYLPHRHVVKHGSTTKLRPVFDASAREREFPSLNQCLETGPNIMEMIPSVLIQFRKNCIGVIADIKRAFLQIGLSRRDRDFLRFLWWKESDDTEPQIYRHARVVFGVSCSPFLLGAVIALHLDTALENASCERYKDVIQKLKRGFYVDNAVCSVSTKDELNYFIRESKSVMATACFDLRGWEYSGDGHGTVTAVLGLMWDKEQDSLSINTKALDKVVDNKITKRTILATAQRLFDPIGFTCPVTLYPKIILQKTWKDNIGWDDDVDEGVKEEFLKWRQELSLLGEVKIPRSFGYEQSMRVSLHTFCDASQLAYATAVFIRLETTQSIRVHLVGAKCRVAPIKMLTIPRLELLAATVGARLTKFILKGLDLKDVQVTLWTDSTTVLAWIQREAQWSTFVWNRVQEIRALTGSENWRHVPGSMNPADLPSRGCTVKQLLATRWWEGPNWLKLPEEMWPMFNFVPNDEEVQAEMKKSVLVTAMSTRDHVSADVEKEPWFSRYFSKYHKVIRLVGWILRFVHNCRTIGVNRTTGDLDIGELKTAEERIWVAVQQESFNGGQDPRLDNLHVYKDKAGLIRVKTKIFNRNDNYSFRCPIVADPKHVITKRLIQQMHEKMCHAGVQVLMGHMRERYWLLGARNGIRAVISKCVICKKLSAKRMETMTPPLPEDRVKEASVFEVTGVDLAGPVFLNSGQKAWICLYTCAVYRAVHLELLCSVSTKGFLEAFRRFVARRGRPTIVYSDNGTNFVGANNVFRRVNWQTISRYSTAERIEWRFNPPSAAWWGGWWERLIRIMKELLRKVLGHASLSYEEMTTVLCDCESVMNSRPLTYVPTDVESLSPLTPAMFLQEIHEIGVPECDGIDRKSLDKRLRYKQRLRDELRARFRKEYLGSLRLGNKIKGKVSCAKVGDVVLVGSDNKKRIDWPLARIVELITGRDGNVRVLRLKTSSGELMRPVQRVYPLELPGDDGFNVGNITRMNDEIENQITTRSGRVSRKPDRLGIS